MSNGKLPNKNITEICTMCLVIMTVVKSKEILKD